MQKSLESNRWEIAVCLESKVIAETEKPSDEAVDCLQDIWNCYGGKDEFLMSRSDWLPRYPELDQLLADCERGRLIGLIPYEKAGEDEAYNWLMWTVRILPGVVEILKEPRKVHRQITIDGVKHDLRNEAGVIMATDPIDLIDLVKINIAHVMNPQEDCGPRRCFQAKLQKTFNLRGQELAPKGSPLREAWINALALPLPKQKRGRTSKLPAEPTLGYVGSESG